jgi:hypothetical protein
VQSIEEAHHDLLHSQNKKHCPIHIKTLKEVFISPYFSTSTIIIAKQLCFDIGLFREDLKTAEDIDFCLKAAVKSNMVEVSAPLSLTRRVENSLGSAITSYQDNLDVIDDFLNDHQQFAQDNKTIIKQVKKKIFDDWLCDLIVMRKLSLALKVGAQSMVIRPAFKTIMLLIKVFMLKVLSF